MSHTEELVLGLFGLCHNIVMETEVLSNSQMC